MARITVRRASQNPLPPAGAAIILGLGVGVAVGFVLGELAGPAAGRALTRRTRPVARQPSVRALVAQAEAALDGDVLLHDCRLEVIPIGRGCIELHGWVDDRRSRVRAAHLVGDAVRAEEIINCLRVRGEDDLAGFHDEPDADELLA